MSDDLSEPPLAEQRPPPTMFSLDDAFGDDTEEQQIQFSSSTVREELARNFGEQEQDEDEELGYLDATRAEAEPDVVTDSAISFANFNSFRPSLPEANLPPRSPRRNGIDSTHLYMEHVSLDRSEPDPETTRRSTTVDPPAPITSDTDVSPSDPDSASQPPPHTPSSGQEEPEKEASTTSLPTESQIQSHHTSQSLSPSPIGSGGHRSSKSAGPSAFEKVMSKTRPQFLPPKPKDEDRKHLADWERMMKLSRAAEDKRKKQLQEQRLMRERAIEQAIEVWEKEILPDWRAAANNPRLRKFWWRGIPPRLRSQVWERTVGNGLALSKDTYRSCLARARRALASGSFPSAALALIEKDISTTLVSLHLFNANTGPMYSDLKDMLCAWVVARSDEGLGYILGASKIAAMFLLNMAPAQAFICMRNLLERHCLRSFYGGLSAKDDVEAYYRIFDTLLADGWPKIYFNFKQHQVSPAAYLHDWISTIFLDHLPLEACARIWDVLLLEGDSFLYRAALAVLAVLEARLFFPERNELLELLRGEDKAALEIARREGKDLKNAKYEIYDVDEEKVWTRIEEMEDWWKESTWTRLIQRELPDI